MICYLSLKHDFIIIIVIINLNIMIIDCKSCKLSLNFNIWFHTFLNVLVCIKLLNETLYKPYSRLGCHPKKCAIRHFHEHRTLFEYNIL